MAVTQKVTLYNNKFTVPPVINAVQNDTDRQVEAYFGDFTLQVGMTGKLSFIRSDGTHYEASATLSTANNTATAELDQALTQAGVTQAQLKITDSGNLGSTFTFMIKVQPDVAGISVPQDGWSAQEFDQRLTDAENAIDAVEEDVADLQDKEYDYAPVITDTASGAIASFPDGADGYPLKECVVNIEAVQSGSGDPSPDNVRPITGFSTAKVTRTGKNLIPFPYEYTSRTINGVMFTVNDDGTITADGTATGGSAVFYVMNNTPTRFNGCALNGCPAGGASANKYKIQFYDETRQNGHDDIGSGVTITRPNGDLCRLVIIIANGFHADNLVFKPMIRLATEDATFESPNTQTVTIDLDGTRYGCTLDVRRGKLRVTMESFSDFSTLLSNGQSNTGAYRYSLLKQNIKGYGEGVSYSNVLKYNVGFNSPANCFYNGTGIINIFLNQSDVASAKQFLSDNNVYIVTYVLPVEIDLTPTEITTLLGINNIWADTGDVSVDYCADTKRWIQKLISQLA